jgi:hypothetical protein
MRKLLLLLIFFISVEALPQTDSMNKNRVEDSTLIKLQKLEDSMLTHLPAIDSNTIKEDLDRNITGILELQKNRRVKEKRAAMIRIGIGVAFLIVLIIGLRRKATKK